MEFERTKSREREQMPNNIYEMALKYRKDFNDRQVSGRLLVKGKDAEVQLSRQGYIQYLLSGLYFKDTALQTWQVFVHDIKKQSGKHRHQGGLVLFILEGRGWSVVDGIRYDWEEGDLVPLPLKPGGVEHQHFNGDPEKGCKWIAFINYPLFDEAASELVQSEVNEDFKKMYGDVL
ncbi:cupin domain-containing protein [Paenibacillus abyssi]|uniref:Cupin type-2 domain-containing protein n=1 Tax=Paenibacillus abyssi TaxID=1340531 RepID=A0A917D0H1_9BACL|nr:cupin domain-containing protein [Paenibacillus abyssi]GGG02022.1 hypothetical protein GCM10010916_18950 [Paenibacillus abyssi]